MFAGLTWSVLQDGLMCLKIADCLRRTGSLLPVPGWVLVRSPSTLGSLLSCLGKLENGTTAPGLVLHKGYLYLSWKLSLLRLENWIDCYFFSLQTAQQSFSQTFLALAACCWVSLEEQSVWGENWFTFQWLLQSLPWFCVEMIHFHLWSLKVICFICGIFHIFEVWIKVGWFFVTPKKPLK